MRTLRYTYWQDGDTYIGFINEYPDYATEGVSREELIENLTSMLEDIESGEIPYIRRVEEFVIPA